MHKRIAATMAVAVGLGLGCSGAAAAQATDSAPPNAGTPAAAPPAESAAPAVGSVAVPPQAAAAPGAQPAVEEMPTVVVTARRTAEDLQSVPVAISAFSADDLQREQIGNAQDLQGRVPSLTISANSQQRSTETPTIRGQGGTFGASPGVVVYMAEVPMPADAATNGQGGPGKFFDLANLQVLKGAQGTLFGRNTTGGALLLEPHKPDNRYEFALRNEGSNLSGDTAEGILNVPLVDDRLLLRVAAQYVTRGGFTHDVASGEDYDNKHYWTSRLGLTWRPTENVENYLMGYYTYSRNNGTGTVIDGFNSSGLNYGLLAKAAPGVLEALPYAAAQALANTLNVGCLYFNSMAPSTNCGQDIVADQQARGVRHVQYSARPNEYYSTGAAVDQFKFDINDQLTLRNIASYSFLKHQFRWDFDGSRAAVDEIVNPDDTMAGDSGQFTEELQLQGTALNDRLKFVTGGYYQNSRPIGPQSEIPVALFNTLPAETYSVAQTSYAPYAQGTYDLGGLLQALDGLKFTVGVRYTTDRTVGSSNAGDATGTEHSADVSKSALTYTAGLDDQIKSTLLYGKISRGYKSGGFMAVAVNPADYTFKPEYVTNYELGQKSDFKIGNVPARIDTAVYYTDYSDMQRAGEDTLTKGGQQLIGGGIFTAGKAEIAGLEMDATVRPFSGFSLAANYALTYAKYKQFTLQNNGLNPQLDCSGQYIATGGTAQLACMPFQATPKHQTSVTAHYLLPMEVASGRIDGSVTYSWTDSQYSSASTLPQAEPGAWLGAFGLLNASLNWSWLVGDKSAINLRAFGTNLTDRTYRISNSNVWNSVYFRSSIYGEPRIFGLQLAYGWGE